MACSNFEETVLLYCSGELSEKEAKSFEEHMNDCDECRKEYDTYRSEQKRFYTFDVLGEAPSAKVDEELKRVCSDSRKKFTATGVLPVFFKRTIYSLTFFVVGFVVVGYFAMNADYTKQDNMDIVLENESINSENISKKVTGDSAKEAFDSLADTNNYYSKNRGNLDLNGVIPVDLKNK